MTDDLKKRAEKLRDFIELSRKRQAANLIVLQEQDDKIEEINEKLISIFTPHFKECVENSQRTEALNCIKDGGPEDVVLLREWQALKLEQEDAEKALKVKEELSSKNEKEILDLRERVAKAGEAVAKWTIDEKKEELARLQKENKAKISQGKTYSTEETLLLLQNCHKTLSHQELLELTQQINKDRPLYNYKSSAAEKMKSLAKDAKEDAARQLKKPK